MYLLENQFLAYLARYHFVPNHHLTRPLSCNLKSFYNIVRNWTFKINNINFGVVISERLLKGDTFRRTRWLTLFSLHLHPRDPFQETYKYITDIKSTLPRPFNPVDGSHAWWTAYTYLVRAVRIMNSNFVSFTFVVRGSQKWGRNKNRDKCEIYSRAYKWCNKLWQFIAPVREHSMFVFATQSCNKLTNYTTTV